MFNDNISVVFLAFCIYFNLELTESNDAAKIGDSSYYRKTHIMQDDDSNKNNAEENENALGKILGDLDRCIENKSKSNDSNYLELCLQTEINSIIFNVMNPYDEYSEAEEHNHKSEKINEYGRVRNDASRTDGRKITDDHKRSKTMKETRRKNISTDFINGDQINVDSDRKKVKKRSVIDGTNSKNTTDKESKTFPSEEEKVKTNFNGSKNTDHIIENLKASVPEANKTNTNLTIKTYSSALNEGIEVSKNNSVVNNTLKLYKVNKTDVEDSSHNTPSKEANSGRSVKILLHDIRQLFDSFLGRTTNSAVLETTRNIKEITIESSTEKNMARTLGSTMNILTSMSKNIFTLPIVRDNLEMLLRYSRSVSTSSVSSILWTLLKTGFSMATRGRGKKDNKGPAVLMSAVLLMSVLLPMVFSAVALIAKKALISSLVALTLSIYAVSQIKSPPHGKQVYEVDGPPPKYNTPPTGHDFPNVPYSFPNDEPKYYGSHTPKQHESESVNYKNVASHDRNNLWNRNKPSDNKNINDNYNRSPTEPNQYEVTERNEFKVRNSYKPIHVPDNGYKPFVDQDKHNTNNEPESNRPYGYTENNYKHYNNMDDTIKHGEGIRHPKESSYKDNREEYHKQYSNEFDNVYEPDENNYKTLEKNHKNNKGVDKNHQKEIIKGINNDDNTYAKESSYKSTDEKVIKVYKSDNEDDVLKGKKNSYSSKVKDKESSSNSYYPFNESRDLFKYTTEYETTISTNNNYRMEPPPTERYTPTEVKHHKFNTINSNDNTRNDIKNELKHFKPMILTTQVPDEFPFDKSDTNNNYYKHFIPSEELQSNKQEDEQSHLEKFNNDFNKPYYTVKDNFHLKTTGDKLDEHRFERPNPVYKPEPERSEDDAKSTRSGFTLAYLPKVKNSSSI